LIEGAAEEFWSSGSEDEGGRGGDDAGAGDVVTGPTSGGAAGVGQAPQDDLLEWCKARIRTVSEEWRRKANANPSARIQSWQLPANIKNRRRPSTQKSPAEHLAAHTARQRSCARTMYDVILGVGVAPSIAPAWAARMVPHSEGVKILLPIMVIEKVFVRLSGCGHSETLPWDTPEHGKLSNFYICSAESVISALQMKGVPMSTINRLTALKSEGGLLPQGPEEGMLLSTAVAVGCQCAGMSVAEMKPDALHPTHILDNPGIYIIGIDSTDKDGQRRHCVSIEVFTQAQCDQELRASGGETRSAQLRDGDFVRYYAKKEPACQEDVNLWLTGISTATSSLSRI